MNVTMPSDIVAEVLKTCWAVVAVLLAVAIPWVNFSTIEVGTLRIPPSVGFLFIFSMVAVGGAIVWSELRALRMSYPAQIPGIAVILLVALTLLSIAGFWYGFGRTGTFSAYVHRPAISLILSMSAILVLSRIVSLLDERHRLPNLLARASLLPEPWFPILAAGTVTAGSAALGYWVLDAMPHMHDGFTYLLQGRMLWSGHWLAVAAPEYPELFLPDMHLRLGEVGFFGKYPIGWPLVLGFFDWLGAAWLANPVIAGAVVWLVYALVKPRQGRTFANLCALVLLVTPWLYSNGATHLSHLTSTVWLLVFAACFEAMRETESKVSAFVSGLSLGAAVLTRPPDALFFSIPYLVVSLRLIVSMPRRWSVPLSLIVVGVAPGVAAYLGTNWYLTGNPLLSGYGDSIGGTLAGMRSDSAWDFLLWMQESWVGLNQQWFTNAFPVVLPLALGVWIGRPYLRGLLLLLAGSASLFIAYGWLQFGEQSWMGPRWYVPLIPAIAILVAAGIARALQEFRRGGVSSALAIRYLHVIGLAVCVTWFLAAPARVVDLILTPPHGADGRVTKAVRTSGISNAVVALREEYFEDSSSIPNYKTLRNGLWTMRFPIESNSVIYVVAIKDWQKKARQMWPTRRLYEISREPGNFTLLPVP